MDAKLKELIEKQVVNRATDNPKLLYKELADGSVSFYLHYILANEPVRDSDGNYLRGSDGRIKRKAYRKDKALGDYVYPNPKKSPAINNMNNENIALVIEAHKEAIKEMELSKGGIKATLEYSKDILRYFHYFVDKTHVKDKRLLKAALQNFENFLREEYRQYVIPATGDIMPMPVSALNKTMMQQFAYYLQDNHKGQGVETYWRRFKRLINAAIDEKIMFENPCHKIKVVVDRTITKAILTEDELITLFATHYKGESKEIRRGFAFTCYSGVRRCDLLTLTYDMVNYEERTLTFKQSKVAGSSSKAEVEIPLDDTLLAIIGTKDDDAQDNYIFHLPSDVMCLKALKHWAARAGIDKNLTWHSGRHTFATLILNNGANIKVVSELLGHSTLKHTQIYVRALKDQKQKAISSMPSLNTDNI